MRVLTLTEMKTVVARTSPATTVLSIAIFWPSCNWHHVEQAAHSKWHNGGILAVVGLRGACLGTATCDARGRGAYGGQQFELRACQPPDVRLRQPEVVLIAFLAFAFLCDVQHQTISDAGLRSLGGRGEGAGRGGGERGPIH